MCPMLAIMAYYVTQSLFLLTNIGISSIYASKPPCSSYNRSIGFFSDKEANDYEQNLARLILANTAMRNSTNPDAIETVELAKKEIAKWR